MRPSNCTEDRVNSNKATAYLVPSISCERDNLKEMTTENVLEPQRHIFGMTEEIGMNVLDHSSAPMSVLLSLSRDGDPAVARQSIVSGTNFFCSLLEEIALQFRHHGKVERWAEELWTWMGRYKGAMCSIIFEPAPVGTKLLALKFLETYILLITPVESDKSSSGGMPGKRFTFHVSWLVAGHPVLDPSLLTSEANRLLISLLDLLQSANNLPGPLTIGVVNCLAAIARKRPHHYNRVLSVLFDFDRNLDTTSGTHAASVQYSLRTAFLGFLRCTHTTIMETRDKLVRALRAMDAGDTADQVIRQVDKMMRNNEHTSRDSRVCKDDPQSSQLLSGDSVKKRPMIHQDGQQASGSEMSAKRIRCNANGQSAQNVQSTIAGSQHHYINEVSSTAPLLNASLNPVEQMISVIAALLAEGERGAKSLEVLAYEIHPDLLADIVVTNMKHLPKIPPSVKKLGNPEADLQSISASSADRAAESPAVTSSAQASVLQSQVSSTPAVAAASLPDSSTSTNLPADSKRDPRRDPHRVDPRRVTVPVDAPCPPVVEETKPVQPGIDGPFPLDKAVFTSALTSADDTQILSTSSMDVDVGTIARHSVTEIDHSLPKEETMEGVKKISRPDEIHLDHSVHVVEEKPAAAMSDHVLGTDIADTPFMLEADELSPTVSNSSTSEESCQELPQVPAVVELSPEEQQTLSKLTAERIIRLYKHSHHRECCYTRMELVTRLVSQINADDHVISFLQKEIVSDYQQIQGHELVMHVLHHLESIKTLEAGDISLHAADVYEKFLLGMAKSLLDTFPAADKSFSRLLGEAPHLTGSALELLENICSSGGIGQRVKDSRESDRVTQGLGAAWSLIIGRPLNREVCLNIALKCAVHPQDDIRTKAIRLVANKLYLLSYIADNVEQYATKVLLSTVDHASDADPLQSGSADQRTDEIGNEEASVSGSQLSEALPSVDNAVHGGQHVSHIGQIMSFSEAQRCISLYFALCTKKPSLLYLIFDLYARAAKTVKQAINRHVPILVRALGSSSSELLSIISDPPEGSENLLMIVLQILTEQGMPSPELIGIVKRLYETKLQDATVLIPMLSSLSKNEVLPIFPRLVDLPSDKFQTALDHILQGSAHTGPALTPAEALVALHDIVPQKDGIPLKKVMDACTTCFEQRTVFTEQVLAKALNHMVDQTPLPVLFMRTVIQAIDAYPSLVHFIMNILAKLVSRQIWKIPKLWVGFLKCVSQTQPHSYDVLLKLPATQLENALVKHGHLRAPLAAHARQPNVIATVPSATLAVLDLDNVPHPQHRQPSHPIMPHDSDSAHGAAPT